MYFRYRPARVADLKPCLTQARDAFAYAPGDHADVLAMWTNLFTEGRTHSMVIEECDTGQIAFFVIMVFVEEAFARSLATDAPPICSGYLRQQWRTGTLPFLTHEQIRTANATTGVNLLCLASGIALDIIEAGRLPFLLSIINDCHPFAFAGFRLSAIYVELYDEPTRTWGDTFGYNRITDYAQSSGSPAHYGDYRPHLFGITKHEAVSKLGAMVSTFFHYTPPRFGFTPPEQELLLWASGGDTDTYLSESLCVAPVTIRKRWDGIYARVVQVQPDFFAPIAAPDGKRGGEKKRRILGYLEHHREELRPYRHSAAPV